MQRGNFQRHPLKPPICMPHAFLTVCFTSYFVFSIAVLPHSPGVVYYHLLLRREIGTPGVAPFSFRRGIWDIFVHRGGNPIHPQPLGSCGPLQEWDAWNMPHHNPWPRYTTGPGIEPGTFGPAGECSTTELTLLLITPRACILRFNTSKRIK